MAKVIARLYRSYLDELVAQGSADAGRRDCRGDAPAAAAAAACRCARQRFGAAFIDDAQDLGIGEIGLLQALFGERLARVTFAGDAAQTTRVRGARPRRERSTLAGRRSLPTAPFASRPRSRARARLASNPRHVPHAARCARRGALYRAPSSGDEARLADDVDRAPGGRYRARTRSPSSRAASRLRARLRRRAARARRRGHVRGRVESVRRSRRGQDALGALVECLRSVPPRLPAARAQGAVDAALRRVARRSCAASRPTRRRCSSSCRARRRTTAPRAAGTGGAICAWRRTSRAATATRSSRRSARAARRVSRPRARAGQRSRATLPRRRSPTIACAEAALAAPGDDARRAFSSAACSNACSRRSTRRCRASRSRTLADFLACGRARRGAEADRLVELHAATPGAVRRARRRRPPRARSSITSSSWTCARARFRRYYVPDAFLFSPNYGMIPKENVGDARAARTAKFTYVHAPLRSCARRSTPRSGGHFACAATRARSSVTSARAGERRAASRRPRSSPESRAARG